MFTSTGSIMLMLGMAIMYGAQIGIFLHAFTSHPGRGLLCLFMPLYIWVYARRHPVSVKLLKIWYVGVACFIVGAVIASA